MYFFLRNYIVNHFFLPYFMITLIIISTLWTFNENVLILESFLI